MTVKTSLPVTVDASLLAELSRAARTDLKHFERALFTGDAQLARICAESLARRTGHILCALEPAPDTRADRPAQEPA